MQTKGLIMVHMGHGKGKTTRPSAGISRLGAWIAGMYHSIHQRNMEVR